MDELAVTRYWMVGVIAVMVVYAVIALFGLARDKSRSQDINSGEEK